MMRGDKDDNNNAMKTPQRLNDNDMIANNNQIWVRVEMMTIWGWQQEDNSDTTTMEEMTTATKWWRGNDKMTVMRIINNNHLACERGWQPYQYADYDKMMTMRQQWWDSNNEMTTMRWQWDDNGNVMTTLQQQDGNEDNCTENDVWEQRHQRKPNKRQCKSIWCLSSLDINMTVN